MLANVYGLSALPFSSDALLALEARISHTHKYFKTFRLSKKKQLPSGMCVCVCVSLRVCAYTYLVFPTKSQGFRFRFTFSTGVQNIDLQNIKQGPV